MNDLDRCILNLARVEDALVRAEETLQRVQDHFDERAEAHEDDEEIEDLYLDLAVTLRELRSLSEEVA